MVDKETIYVKQLTSYIDKEFYYNLMKQNLLMQIPFCFFFSKYKLGYKYTDSIPPIPLVPSQSNPTVEEGSFISRGKDYSD